MNAENSPKGSYPENQEALPFSPQNDRLPDIYQS
ncbi:MAG: hypothetical protein UT36_C0015G0012 [Candidatus Peregrinibacteria bacterium GW2011_GWF2_39_17]|nr:MAG: hypothetical protein UT36_C0015G0012 [Candidatus Peregrinibacteria bacterium GW2011_GWF2_39_17]